jgi:hypothetical protein
LVSARYATQPHWPSAQQFSLQPQSPVQTPVWQQPQSQFAQQHDLHSVGHLSPQQAGIFALEEPETNADSSISIRKYMAILQETGWVNGNKSNAKRAAAISSAKRSRGYAATGRDE